jgi:curved DNA-binding protein CbpA
VGPGGDPWAPFTVQPDTGLDELKRQYRVLARRHYPDRGGDPRMMARINLLYADLLRWRA